MNIQQVFYIQYRSTDGYLTTLKDQQGYNALSDDDKKQYTQVVVDLQHLSGWGLYWDKVRYINGALSYPDNYPKDQSATIADLKQQVSNMISSNNATQNNSNNLKTKLTNSNNKIKQLGQLSMILQQQLAKSESVSNQDSTKIKQLGNLVMQLQQRLATKNTNQASNK